MPHPDGRNSWAETITRPLFFLAQNLAAMIGRADASQFVSNQVGEKQREILRDGAKILWRSSDGDHS